MNTLLENPSNKTSAAPHQNQARPPHNILLVDDDLRAQWTAWDNGDEPARQAAQKTMVALLDRRRYLSNLVRDVTETLGA